jgi:hypothetical protein
VEPEVKQQVEVNVLKEYDKECPRGVEEPRRRGLEREDTDNEVLKNGGLKSMERIAVGSHERRPPHTEGVGVEEDTKSNRKHMKASPQGTSTGGTGTSGRRSQGRPGRAEKEGPEKGPKEQEKGLAGIEDFVGCVAEATPDESIELVRKIGESSVHSFGGVSDS